MKHSPDSTMPANTIFHQDTIVGELMNRIDLSGRDTTEWDETDHKPTANQRMRTAIKWMVKHQGHIDKLWPNHQGEIKMMVYNGYSLTELEGSLLCYIMLI